MQYPDFNSIDIDVPKGVCPVSGDTYMLARHAASLSGTVLEVGTGSGFVAVYLATLGLTCDASDIHELAVETVTKNAERNGVKVETFVSNLFSNITDQYDIILFNPPYGSARDAKSASRLEFIKALVPRNNPLIAKLVYLLIRKQRRALITEFIAQAKEHLREGGSILLVVHKKELDLVEPYNARYVDQWKDVCLAEFTL